MRLFLFTGVEADTVLIKAENLERAVELAKANLPEYQYQEDDWVANRITELNPDEGVIHLTRPIWS